MAQLTLYGTETVDMPQVLLPLANGRTGTDAVWQQPGRGENHQGCLGTQAAGRAAGGELDSPR